jgi:hypothetical protein
MEMLFGKLPEFFKDEAELRAIWSARPTRARSYCRGSQRKASAETSSPRCRKIIDAEKSDPFDVLAHVAYAWRRRRAKSELRGPKSQSARASTASSRSFSTSCYRTMWLLEWMNSIRRN